MVPPEGWEDDKDLVKSRAEEVERQLEVEMPSSLRTCLGFLLEARKLV
jgi:hypothetical protein